MLYFFIFCYRTLQKERNDENIRPYNKNIEWVYIFAYIFL